jgi:DNA repair photolyase
MLYKPQGPAGEYGKLAANLYKGCGNGCTYCYARMMAKAYGWKNDFHQEVLVKKDALKELEKDCRRISKQKGEKHPIFMSFMNDPYMMLDMELGLTREAIKIIHRYGFNVKLLSKNGTNACRDFDLLGNNDHYGATLTFIDDNKSKEWEPGAALPKDRIEALRIAHSKGIKTWVSMEPVIEPEETLQLIRETHEFIDEYKIGMLHYHSKSKEIDWQQFGNESIKLLESYGSNYVIKADLKKHLIS